MRRKQARYLNYINCFVCKYEDKDWEDHFDYLVKLKDFVVAFYKQKFAIDISQSGGSDYMYEVEDNEYLVINLGEYKRITQNQVPNPDHIQNFFKYFAEENGIVNPYKSLFKEQILNEIKTRQQEMLKCFDKVEVLN